MEKDKQLQQLLQNAAERSSLSFTQTVMNRVEYLAAHSFSYKPLVSAKSKRLFIAFYVSVLIFIVITCLLITVPVIPFLQSIPMPQLPANFFRSVISGLLLFWIFFGANFYYQKRLLIRR